MSSYGPLCAIATIGAIDMAVRGGIIRREHGQLGPLRMFLPGESGEPPHVCGDLRRDTHA
ncbi:hypothetical protein [Streptomyces sp. NPDC048142]|uniref:hypothetical protein n=1 Tax=Streptomyces sp. NPDC048142 TaxID=3365501 RepID=UPI0037153788